MSHTVRLLFVLLFLFVPSQTVASQPATVCDDPYQILHQHYQAVGGLDRLKNLKSSFAEGRIRHDQLHGTFKSWAAPPLRYRLEEDYGIIQQQEGDDGSQRWQQDTNGQLLLDRDPETLKRRRIEARLARYEHLDKNSDVFTLAYLGVAEVNGHFCDQIELRNNINSDLSLFFIDRETRLMPKSIHRQPDYTLTSYYHDFREVDRFIFPFYENTLITPWNKEEEVWVEQYRVDLPIDEKLFAVPKKPAADFYFPEGMTSAEVSFLFVENMIFLPLCIADECRYWTLDSGASMSVIDADYAAQLGLKPQGEISGYGFGELFKLAFVELPRYRVGQIAFEPQKIYVSQGLMERSYEPVVAGILGYDFLSRFVVDIDYAAGKVRFHAPQSYQYSGSGQLFDAPLKYRTFQLPVSLEGLKGQWSLDLGSHRSSLLYPFAERHNLLQRPGVETVSQGLTGVAFEQESPFEKMQIGRFELNHQLVSIPKEKGAGASALGEIAGYLGNATLRNFRVILDYPHQQVILEEGAGFNQPVPRDGSGMLLGLSKSDQPMVSFVADKSPASRAGFVGGDLIVQVNERSVENFGGVVPIRKLLRQPAGTGLLFQVQRGDDLLKLSLELQDLHPFGAPSVAP